MKAREQASAIGAATVGTGAALTAGVASACCVGPAVAPILVTILGAGGLAAVSGVRPYTPWLLLASGAMLGFSFWQTYRRPACAVEGSAITPPFGLRVARFITWAAALLWLASAIYALYGFLNE
jgi:mercuric ion transport protein